MSTCAAPSLSELQELSLFSRATVSEYLLAPLSQERKQDGSWVTVVDRQTEAALRSWIEERFPTHSIFGEEYEAKNGSGEFTWVIDPIDGTEDFVRGLSTYGTVVGVFQGDQSIGGYFDFPSLGFSVRALKGVGFEQEAPLKASVASDESPLICLPPLEAFARTDEQNLMFALQGAFPKHRILYTCLSMALAVTGRVDATVEWNLSLWDFSPLEGMCHEAKRDFEWLRKTGEPKQECFVCGRREVVSQVAEIVRALL